jgi:hypothetical protein
MAIESTGIGAGIMEIAAGLLGIGLIALVLNRSSDATNLIKQGGNTFNTLLNTVTLQNSGFAPRPSNWQ